MTASDDAGLDDLSQEDEALSPAKREHSGWTEGQKRPSSNRERDCCEEMCTPQHGLI